jgi:hypothetical protein
LKLMFALRYRPQKSSLTVEHSPKINWYRTYQASLSPE